MAIFSREKIPSGNIEQVSMIPAGMLAEPIGLHIAIVNKVRATHDLIVRQFGKV